MSSRLITFKEASESSTTTTSSRSMSMQRSRRSCLFLVTALLYTASSSSATPNPGDYGNSGQYSNTNRNNYDRRNVNANANVNDVARSGRDNSPPPPPPQQPRNNRAEYYGDEGRRYDNERYYAQHYDQDEGRGRRRRRDIVEDNNLNYEEQDEEHRRGSGNGNRNRRRDSYDYGYEEDGREHDANTNYPGRFASSGGRRDENDREETETTTARPTTGSGRGFFGGIGSKKGDDGNRKSNNSSFSSGANSLFKPFGSMGSDNNSKQSQSRKGVQEETNPKQYNPIDYQFPSREITNHSEEGDEKETSTLPLQDEEEGDKNENDTRRGNFLRPGPRPGPRLGSGPGPSTKLPRQPGDFASARNDAVARYRATSLGKIKLSMSSFIVGAMTGGFVGQSIMGHGSGGGNTIAILFGILFWIMSMLRNDYGEMSRSLGLGLIYLIRRTKAVRKKYRTGGHVRGMCRLGKRKPFPPAPLNADGEVDARYENPWKYEPQSENDPEFDMIKALISMALIGSFCGGNIPLIPTWMGGAGGAAAFVAFGIAKNARGDLIRTMGMRIVALAGEAMDINAELNCARKVGRVGGKVFDKMMILDRKHRIKDRIIRGATFVYQRASSTASRVQDDMKERRNENDDIRRGDDFDNVDRRRERRPPPRGAR